jgi:RHS repeat-associated protein
LLSLLQAGQTYEYLYDGKGNVSAVIDENQAIVASYRYDAFGVLLSESGSLNQPMRFSTKYYDADTGLSDYGYRFYVASVGRWLNRDPIGENGGVNLYGFVGNNALNFVDPYGLDAIYINYDYYPVTTPVGKIPLGHGGVVALNSKTGTTKYYEFGRYDEEKKGIVRSRSIPNVVIGEDGLPTEKSLNNLYDYLSKKFGKNSNVTPTYYSDSDFQGTINFAEAFKKEHPDYSLLSNNCKTFGKNAATACKKGLLCK